MFDFTAFTSDLQGVFAGAVTAMFVFIVKLIFLGMAIQVAILFLPRWLRPFVSLAALLLVAAYPAQLSVIADPLLARAGLLPPAGLSAPAGFAAPASLAGIQSQVQGTLDSFIAFLTSQLGL